MVRARPGIKAIMGAISMYWRPVLLNIPPQLGAGGGMPRPRKLKLASARIMAAMRVVNRMIIGAIMLGRM
jgi:hypothetical protein